MFLLSYKEFVDKFKMSIKPNGSAVVFDAVPKSVLILLPNFAVDDLAFSLGEFMTAIFIFVADVLKEKE